MHAQIKMEMVLMINKKNIIILVMSILILIFPFATKAEGGEQDFETMETTDEQDCDEECSRRGYDDGVCYVTSYVPSQNNNWCPGDNYIDIVGKIGKCKSGWYYGMYLKLDCLCCHDCPGTAPTITRTIGDKCTLTLTPHAWDDDDGDIHGYSDFSKSGIFSQSGIGVGFGIHSIEVSMDDNKEKKLLWVLPMEDCKANLKFKNSWWIHEVDSLIVRTEISEKDAGNKLSAGFDISVSGDGCTFSGNSPCPTSDTQKMVTDSGFASKTYNIEYCGDGECDTCGENAGNCPTDCGCVVNADCNSQPVKKKCDVDNGVCVECLPADNNPSTLQNDYCDSGADCDIASHYWWLDTRTCSVINTCTINYRYCNGVIDNCAIEFCGDPSTINYCTNDGSTWKWRKTLPAETRQQGNCNDGFDNDCDNGAGTIDTDPDTGIDGADSGCCNSGDYKSCGAKKYLRWSGTETSMCGDDQYYYSSTSVPTKMTWTIAPESTVDYDLYIKKGGTCPTTSGGYDERTYGGAGVSESLTSCVSSGESNLLVHKLGSGTGSYDISLTKLTVGCCADTDCTTDPDKSYCDTVSNKCVGCVDNLDCENNPKGNKCLNMDYPDKDNVCGCLVFNDCAWSSGTEETFCPNIPPIIPPDVRWSANNIMPTCTALKECECDPSCGTGSGATGRCADDYCCTGEEPQGPNIKVGEPLKYSCVLEGYRLNPWLCV